MWKQLETITKLLWKYCNRRLVMSDEISLIGFFMRVSFSVISFNFLQSTLHSRWRSAGAYSGCHQPPVISLWQSHMERQQPTTHTHTYGQ